MKISVCLSVDLMCDIKSVGAQRGDSVIRANVQEVMWGGVIFKFCTNQTNQRRLARINPGGLRIRLVGDYVGRVP